MGGPHITIMKEQALLGCFDYAFIGEAEWSRGCNADGDIVSTGQPPADITDLDALPISRIACRCLATSSESWHGSPFTSIQTMRGCPWKCIFCASEALKTTEMRVRSPRSVVNEMRHVVGIFGTRHFYIVDDIMTLWKDHILEICDLIDQEGCRLPSKAARGPASSKRCDRPIGQAASFVCRSASKPSLKYDVR
ncbi:MAG: hypothetical protein MRJ92_05740 [Nitrospira sp.]|nr:hypothetical protein [Nitrospira sp.]